MEYSAPLNPKIQSALEQARIDRNTYNEVMDVVDDSLKSNDICLEGAASVYDKVAQKSFFGSTDQGRAIRWISTHAPMLTGKSSIHYLQNNIAWAERYRSYGGAGSKTIVGGMQNAYKKAVEENCTTSKECADEFLNGMKSWCPPVRAIAEQGYDQAMNKMSLAERLSTALNHLPQVRGEKEGAAFAKVVGILSQNYLNPEITPISKEECLEGTEFVGRGDYLNRLKSICERHKSFTL